MQASQPPQRVPGPGFLFAFDVRRRGPLALAEAARAHGDVLRFRVGPRVIYLLNSAEHAHHIFIDNARNYRKSPGSRKVRDFLGEGLLTSEGERWRRHRALLLPGFQKRALPHVARVAEERTGEMLARWAGHADSGHTIDLHAEMMTLAFQIVAYSACSGDLHGQFPQVHQAFRVAFEHTVHRLHSLIDVPLFLPTPRNLRFRRAVRTLDEFAYEVIARRRREGCRHEDLLDALLAPGDGAAPALTDREVRDELVTFIVGGYDTVSAALSWSLYFLSRSPEAVARLRAEAPAAPPSSAAAPSYARMVFSEAMRYYAPVWVLARQALGDDAIGGYRIPAGGIVVVSPYLLHRDPRYWDNPEEFIPERFEPAAAARRPSCAFLPFGAGQRQCLGMNMAYVEAEVVLPAVVRHYNIVVPPGYRAEWALSITLSPRGGIPATLHKVK